MAIVVETGAIVAGANSYVDMAYADSYHGDRGSTAWEDTDPDVKEAALIRATASIDIKYRGQWYGVKTNNNDGVDQLRAWPRKKESGKDTPLKDVDGIEIGINAIPQAVKDAACEVALIELTERFLTTKLSRDDMVVRKKTDVLETEWAKGAPAVPLFPHIDEMLIGLASADTNGISMSMGLTEREQEIMDGGLHNFDDALADKGYFN